MQKQMLQSAFNVEGAKNNLHTPSGDTEMVSKQEADNGALLVGEQK